jgi:hypothetical protein
MVEKSEKSMMDDNENYLEVRSAPILEAIAEQRAV